LKVKIEGLVSRKVIKLWLENYESLVVRDRPFDALPANSSYKSPDGVSNGVINKIMLEAAVKALPGKLFLCVYYRWIMRQPLNTTLRLLGDIKPLPKTTYYRRCDKAVDFIYYHINGMAAQLKDLVDRILLGRIDNI
jgi:hypothetical protein